MTKQNSLIVPDEVIANKIYLIRNQKVMLDSDLAELYQVETKVLKQSVKRNVGVFPEHFMFELTETEFESLRSQIVTSKKGRGGTRYLPMVFTEYGVLQLASVLRSERAKQMSIRIIEIFVRLREMFLTNKDILIKLGQMERKIIGHDEEIQLIFQYLKQLLNPPEEPRKKIGFKTGSGKNK